MIVLALDTTTRAGSAAVVRGGDLLAEISGDARLTHGQRLPGELMQVLEAAGLTLHDVDLLAIAAGPGSFTGLRVGIAAMQGLAMATAKPIVPVSTLEALAHAAGVGGSHTGVIAPWVDAQRGQVFASLYDAAGCSPLSDPTSLPPAATIDDHLAHAGRESLRFVGDGAVRYAAEITARLGPGANIDPLVPRLAGHIARIAAAAADRAVPPHAVAPIYVRRPDAELARERRTQGA
jgi:tRNA threonylcarbamoyladenosine biosynthesis protein TsaB